MHLGADESVDAGRVMPARMLNEFTYCPRLFYLEWVQGEFEDNEYTVEGRVAHKRVDMRGGALPAADEKLPFEVRSVALSSPELGISAKIDLVEGEGGLVFPVDYKRGSAPEDGPHEPERVQLCAYGLLLRAHGYKCEKGVLYFVASKTRVEVELDEALCVRTLELLAQARAAAAQAQIPPPLVGSPKCNGCSLHGICLPDEVSLLAHETAQSVRPLVTLRDEAQPLYVQEQGARVGLDGQVLIVRDRERKQIGESRLIELSQLVLIGNVSVSAQAIREVCGRGIPVCWMSFGGWLAAMADGI